MFCTWHNEPKWHCDFKRHWAEMTLSFQEALSRRHDELMIALRVWCKWVTIAMLQLELATANDCCRPSKTPLPAKDDEWILYVCVSDINHIGIYGIHVTLYEVWKNKWRLKDTHTLHTTHTRTHTHTHYSLSLSPPLCVSLSLSLSLTHTHSHTHTVLRIDLRTWMICGSWLPWLHRMSPCSHRCACEFDEWERRRNEYIPLSGTSKLLTLYHSPCLSFYPL